MTSIWSPMKVSDDCNTGANILEEENQQKKEDKTFGHEEKATDALEIPKIAESAPDKTKCDKDSSTEETV